MIGIPFWTEVFVDHTEELSESMNYRLLEEETKEQRDLFYSIKKERNKR